MKHNKTYEYFVMEKYMNHWQDYEGNNWNRTYACNYLACYVLNKFLNASQNGEKAWYELVIVLETNIQIFSDLVFFNA
jgi:hypothetical protein